MSGERVDRYEAPLLRATRFALERGERSLNILNPAVMRHYNSFEPLDGVDNRREHDLRLLLTLHQLLALDQIWGQPTKLLS